MTGKEIVNKAIKMTNPPRIPLLFLNKDLEKSDFHFVNYMQAANFQYAGTNHSEWGFDWEKLDDTMGQPKNPPVTSWEALDCFVPPDPDDPARFVGMAEDIEANKDKYIIGSLGITGFNLATFVRGFEATLEGLYIERPGVEKLLDMVVAFECGIISHFGKHAVDCISFGDDWGTQKSLMISPGLWREVFKPRYREQFDLVHKLGKHVYFHCCGYIHDIIPDLIEIGADVLNLNQPDLFGVEELGREFGGKVCFNCPVDHQTVAIHGTRREIFDYVRRLKEHLGRFNGGFIGYIEEYHSIGMSAENYRAIVEAFESLNGTNE
jgi:uroporphyrinogen decarboxylase